VQVNLNSGVLLQAVAQFLLANTTVDRKSVHSALDPLMPLLVDRLGEPNARVDKTAREALLGVGRCQCVGAPFTAQFLLKLPKKKTVHARVFTSRLMILTALALDYGVQPESRDGVPLESTVQLAMECFSNKDGDVRDNCVKLVGACYMHIGLGRIEGYLSNLRPAQREVFDAEFDRISGGHGAGHGAGGKSPAGGGGLPPPAVPPPRGGGGGGAAYQQEEQGFDDQEPQEFTCQFCGRQDSSFTPEALDVHYWRDCAMLTQCNFCQQVIEISTLRTHLTDECESGQAAQEAGANISAHECPLCRADIGNGEDQDWLDHLLQAGCPQNPRSNGQAGSAPGQ